MAGCCNADYLGPKLNALLTRIESYLIDCDRGPCRSVIEFGAATPYDNCCECSSGEGQLWISVVSLEPVAPAQGAPTVCGATWDVTLIVGLTRCALTIDERGNAPDDIAVSIQNLDFLKDRALVVGAIHSLTADETIDPHDMQWGTATLDNRGGCLSFEQSITLSMSDCCNAE